MSIKEILSVIAPGIILEIIEDSLGFQLHVENLPLGLLAISSPGRDGDRFISSFHNKDTNIEVTAQCNLDMEQRAVVIQLKLHNYGSEQSRGFSALYPVCLTFRNAQDMRMQIHSAGGGLNPSFYPPNAYRANSISVMENCGSESFRIESGNDGRSSSKDLPMLILTAEDGNSSAGMFCALEWSGEWFLEALIDRAGKDVKLRGGPQVFSLTLNPGESLKLPPAHLVFFEGDLNEGINAARSYIYNKICPECGGERPLPPVSYDHYFGIGCDFDEEFLQRQADCACQIGVEYFVLDAGWYKGCGPGNEFSRGVGNWELVDDKKFPNGLESLAEYVRSKGMQFGLWFEPERAHRASNLATRHPEWFWDVGEDFLHLNLTLKEAQDYIIELIGGYIKCLDLRWSRWDYNIGPKPFWEKADPTGKVQFAYVEGLYRVLDTLMQEHKEWQVECCASGGQRIDLGTLKRAHTVWISDHTLDPNWCRFMQLGANRFLPGHLLNSSIPIYKGEGDKDIGNFDVLSRMCGALSFDGDVASWSNMLTRLVGKLVGIYKEIRHLLVQDFYPLQPNPSSDSDWDGAQFISYDKEESIVFIFRMLGKKKNKRIRLKGLNGEVKYRIADPVGGGEQDLSGRELLKRGLSFSLPPNCAALRYLRQIKGRHA